jgi:hypothetical protein
MSQISDSRPKSLNWQQPNSVYTTEIDPLGNRMDHNNGDPTKVAIVI